MNYLSESLGAFPNPIVDNQLLLSSAHEPSNSYHSDLKAVFWVLKSVARLQTDNNLSYNKHNFGSTSSL